MTEQERAEKKRLRDALKPCKECGTKPVAGQPTVHEESCSVGKALASAAEAAKAAAPEDLDDVATQRAILSPEPFAITIGGEATQMYPLPADARCEVAWDFWPDVIEKAREIGILAFDETMSVGQKGTLFLGRCARTIVRNPSLKSRFARFIARAERAPADDADDALLDARAKVIGLTLEPEELFIALTRFYITAVANPKATAQPQ